MIPWGLRLYWQHSPHLPNPTISLTGHLGLSLTPDFSAAVCSWMLELLWTNSHWFSLDSCREAHICFAICKQKKWSMRTCISNKTLYNPLRYSMILWFVPSDSSQLASYCSFELQGVASLPVFHRIVSLTSSFIMLMSIVYFLPIYKFTHQIIPWRKVTS